MKILFLNIYQGISDRGAEIFVKEISSRLLKNHEVEIISAVGKISQQKAITHTPLNFFGKILYKFYLDAHDRRVLFFTLSQIPKILSKKYDWVIPVDGGWQLLFVKLLQPLGRYKILVSGQAGIGRDDLRNLRMNPDVFVALTNRAYAWAKEINTKIMVAKIPNGVDLLQFNPEGIEAKFNLEKPIVICVAGLNPYKKVNLTIKAVSKLEGVSLLLVGDGPLKQEIEALGEQLLGQRFLRVTVPHDELASYYRSASLFTLVSEPSEAFGIAYLEAMACNLPVVATDDENRHEIVGEAGLFVDPLDIEEYKEKLKKAMGIDFDAIPRRQAEKFSWDKVAEEYERAMNGNH